MAAKRLHIVMFPWFAFGHMTPYLHLSNKLAEKGHKVTFLLPTKANLQLQPLNLYPSLITLHPITVPHVDPLPPGTQTASDVPFPLHTHLATAMDLTRPEFESTVASLLPDVIFFDMACWVPQVASKLGIKSVSYNVVCAAAMALAMVPARERPDVAQPPPGYPSSTVVLEPRRMLNVLTPFGEGLTLHGRITASLTSSDVIAVRTCREIEGKFCDYLASQYNKPVLLTGPILPESMDETKLDDHWTTWLGRFGPGKVVFCAFGSQSNLNKAQFQELLLGFEMTELPFLVALRPPEGFATVEEAFPEGGFVERVGGRGVVYGEWVPQTQILAHPSVGCFVSHCGFGSMWESLMSDNQIVLIPQLADQFLNSKIMAMELKVAVEVEINGGDPEGWVSKESLCKAIKSVMDQESEIGCLVKMNHAMWRETFVSQGFMSNYIDNFIKDLEILVGS